MMPSYRSDLNLDDAKKFVEREGLSMETRIEFYMDPLALLEKRTGFYIVKLVAGYKDERNDDEHFIAYYAHAGHLIDNDQFRKIIEVEESDRSTKKLALLCITDFFD